MLYHQTSHLFYCSDHLTAVLNSYTVFQPGIHHKILICTFKVPCGFASSYPGHLCIPILLLVFRSIICLNISFPFPLSPCPLCLKLVFKNGCKLLPLSSINSLLETHIFHEVFGACPYLFVQIFIDHYFIVE